MYLPVKVNRVVLRRGCSIFAIQVHGNQTFLCCCYRSEHEAPSVLDLQDPTSRQVIT